MFLIDTLLLHQRTQQHNSSTSYRVKTEGLVSAFAHVTLQQNKCIFKHTFIFDMEVCI